jgi:hypothetical protein
MSVVNQVLVEFAPTLTPTRLERLDMESRNAEVKAVDPSGTGYISQFGKGQPFVQISGYQIELSNIMSLIIFQNELIPKIHLSFMDNDFAFTSHQFPIMKPLVTMYLAPSNLQLKSIAADFFITSIKALPIKDSVRYDVVGELHIPGIYSNKSTAYRAMSSVDVMRKIASELGLGFATNEDKTNDTMTWINPNLNYKAFIEQVISRAYTNEKSFYTCFIDKNYILNFINVEKQFSRESEVDVTYAGNMVQKLDPIRFDYDNKPVDELVEVPMILTNSQSAGTSDLSIYDYAMVSENGDILKTESFRKRLYWYPHGENKPIDHFIEPISDLSPENGSVHQKPELTEFENGEVVKWIGVDYQNAHSNYKFARAINTHNKKEIEKHMLRVVLNGANFSILRGSRVKVEIIGDAAYDIIGDAYFGDAEPGFKNPGDVNVPIGVNNEYIDEHLSDFYYVKDIVIKYKPLADPQSAFYTEMMLTKRNWFTTPEKLLTPNE